MNKLIFWAALLLGGIAVGWISSVMAHASPQALAVTLITGCVYSIGAVELFQFRRATSTLLQALSDTGEKVASLDEWLDRLDASLRSPVRFRIEGERVGLPAPIVTPYLIGLLVMLGLLGTFIGMVETLRGAVIALEGATEIQAIREGLAAPIRGLGLAFGTSVAGVATSAMLGLMSTLSRRDRIQASRLLDSKTATVFQAFSFSRNRQETFRAIQMQTRALPEMIDKMAAMAEKLDRVGDRLLDNQDHFHASAKTLYAELAASVDQSHKENLLESVRLAGAHIRPILQEAMTGITAETQNVHALLTRTARENIETLSGLFVTASAEVNRSWQAGVEAHAKSNATLTGQLAGMLTETVRELTADVGTAATRMHQEVTNLLHSSGNLIQTRMDTETAWLNQHGERMNTLTATLRAELGALREDENRRGEAAAARLTALESRLSTRLVQLGKEIEVPMSRLIQTAAEVPLAAAEVIRRLREEAAGNVERDHRLLEEHRGLLTQIDALTHTIASTSGRQHEAIEDLVGSSADMLKEIGHRFTEHVGTEASHVSGMVENFAVSAVEIASLGEAFGTAVQVFVTANHTLIENLGRIEASLDKTADRSNEQLAYYIAQAREIVDHCMVSQKEIFEELQQLRPKNTPHLEMSEWKN